MSTYAYAGGRIPRPKEPPSSTQRAPARTGTPATTFFSHTPGSQVSRSQIARPSGVSTKAGRSASFSAAEESRSLTVPSSTSMAFSRSDIRPTLIPRRASVTLSPTQRPPEIVSSQFSALPRAPASLISAPHVSASTGDPLADARPRNVLRRRAPTIGKMADVRGEQSDRGPREKLNVTIPEQAPGAVERTLQTPWASTKSSSDRFFSSQEAGAERRIQILPTEGPKELASLRTTINTQNLPPPTPNFPSASSPSTRYSESPGIWSRTSQTSTPISLSSYSPGITHSAKANARLRQNSPSQSRLPAWSPAARGSPWTGNHRETIRERAPIASKVSDPGTPALASRRDDIRHGSDAGNIRGPESVTEWLQMPSMQAGGLSDTRQGLNIVQEQQSSVDLRLPKPLGISSIAVPVSHSIEPAPTPLRPSRAGIDEIELQPSPVIQSNLPARSFMGHKRRESGSSSIVAEKLHPTPVRSAAVSVDSLQSGSSTRIQSRSTTSQPAARKSPRTLTKEPKKREPSKTPEPSKKFGLFSKNTKKSQSESHLPDQVTTTKKGPVAGTGHEGYGRYAQRGRKASVSSTGGGPRGRSTSTTRSVAKSVASSKGSAQSRPELDIDDFLLDRLEPVVIQGGGQERASLTRTQSEQSAGTTSIESASPLTKHTKPPQGSAQATDSLTPSKGAVDAVTDSVRIAIHPRRIDNVPTRMALSSQENVKATDARPSLDVSSSELTALPLTKVDSSSSERTRKDSTSSQGSKPEKKGRASRWNFFQRNQDRTRKIPVAGASPVKVVPQLPAAVSAVPAARPLAHYAIVDVDSDPLEDILHGVEESPPTEPEDRKPLAELPVEPRLKRSHVQSILLPSPPKLHGEFSASGRSSPKVFFSRDVPHTMPERSSEDTRQSRLTSIGRIPRVVSRRDRQHKPALQSFSRPFSVVDAPSLTAVAPMALFEASDSHLAHYPDQTGLVSPRTSKIVDTTSHPTKGLLGTDFAEFVTGSYSNKEFLVFSPRKGSELSTSSGSESTAAVTARVPDLGAAPTEDEIWNEYDDLIDDVLSPERDKEKKRRSSKSSPEAKLELATKASRRFQAELNAKPSTRTLSTLVEPPSVAALSPVSMGSDTGSVRLRRSQIVSALHSSIGPSTQASYSDLIANYGTMNADAETPISAKHMPVRTPPFPLSSPPAPQSFETSRKRNTLLFDIAERDREGAMAQANVRSGSLMISRWLSFGRVLFSPAHSHVQSAEREKIFVLDGLGNDDWSFYCALTYPTADVYSLNIGPTAPATTHPAAWQPPKNHYTVHHPSLEGQLPFPNGFFKVTVLRFPAACSEMVQQNMISECKRVLRTGGYLEMSILDLDMVNMGVRTRKAVRCLKERTYLTDASISLKSASDSFQRHLGQHGFDNLRRCMVQIPVAGVSIGSSDSSSSNQSNKTAAGATSATALSATPSTAFSISTATETSSLKSSTTASIQPNTNTREDLELSLGDLLSDPTPSPNNDQSIAKIVAKVGRWWYTRCYEIPVLEGGNLDLSIWADRKVLRECQKRGTGFRFLIAYAQKPSAVTRRTASV